MKWRKTQTNTRLEKEVKPIGFMSWRELKQKLKIQFGKWEAECVEPLRHLNKPGGLRNRTKKGNRTALRLRRIRTKITLRRRLGKLRERKKPNNRTWKGGERR